MDNTATLSSKYQISIPKAVRAAHPWKPGQRFAFIPKGSGVQLIPVPGPKDLKGLVRGADTGGYRDRTDRA